VWCLIYAHDSGKSEVDQIEDSLLLLGVTNMSAEFLFPVLGELQEFKIFPFADHGEMSDRDSKKVIQIPISETVEYPPQGMDTRWQFTEV